MEEDFFCQCYSICQREFFMILVFRNNDKLSTRFIYFQPEEQRAGVTLLVCFYFFFIKTRFSILIQLNVYYVK